MGVPCYVLGVSGGGAARNPDGQVPDRMEVFRMTHTRRDGQLVDQASEDVMRLLNERLSKHPESSQSSTTRDDIFTQVMGEERHGRVRTFGLGITPSNIFGPRASIAEARAAALESARIAEMERSQRIALQEEVVQMRTQLNQLMTWMQSFTGSGSSSSSSVPYIKDGPVVGFIYRAPYYHFLAVFNLLKLQD